jgi:hypothetical protein
MASFCIDLGFDWNIRDENGQVHLQDALVAQGPLVFCVASYFKVITTGSEVSFYVYDITGDGAKREIVGGEIEFRAAIDGVGMPSPFPDSLYPIPPGLTSEQGNSLAFNGLFPKWHALEPTAVVNDGKFVFKVSLTVNQSGVEKRFVVDPEMETGSGG